jgi:hypothetical protein
MYQSIAQEQVSTEPWSQALVDQLQAARRSVLPQEALGERRAWRDRRLMALVRHKKELDSQPSTKSSP